MLLKILKYVNKRKKNTENKNKNKLIKKILSDNCKRFLNLGFIVISSCNLFANRNKKTIKNMNKIIHKLFFI